MLAAADTPLYPMRSVVRLTGVDAHRIRYWEAKYSLLRPARRESGRRLYSRHDVNSIKRIAVLLDRHGVDLATIRSLMAS